jgi:hypothetical protein
MDKVETYSRLIREILSRWARIVASQPTPGMETLLAFDDERGQYLWLQVGYERGRRVHAVTVHARLVDGKIRVEQDWTEDGIATALAHAGVPWEDMTFGFHEPALTEPASDTLHLADRNGVAQGHSEQPQD